jgi:hypothetical protein
VLDSYPARHQRRYKTDRNNDINHAGPPDRQNP